MDSIITEARTATAAVSEVLDPRSETEDLRFHPQRTALFNELHTRPFPLIASPARVSHLAVSHDAQSRSQEYEHLCRLCAHYSLNPPAVGSSCYYQNFGGFELRWERHTEFSTYTILCQPLVQEPFQERALGLLPEAWLRQLSGTVISALHVEIWPEPDEPLSRPQLRHFFEGHRLIGGIVDDNLAKLWTAYRIHKDGFGRVLIFNRGLNECQTGRLVRALVELETYRMMALLAFPLARRIAPEIGEMDRQLARIIQQITDIADLDDERRLLGELSTLAARVEQIVSDTNYRFSATEAYYALVLSRLDELREREINGLVTLRDFLRRRLTPAYRTCEAVREDLEDLSQRIDRASELLRTRVNLTIEAQNQHLLQSMDRRSKMQLRMQQAVEGLSVAAISYYMVGLIKYLLTSAKVAGWPVNTDLLVGFSVPLVIGLVWWGLSRLKQRIKADRRRST